jgi:hypothetical protein
MRIQYLRVEITPHLRARPDHADTERHLQINVRVDGLDYAFQRIHEENDLERFWDTIFDTAKDEIKKHIEFERRRP